MNEYRNYGFNFAQSNGGNRRDVPTPPIAPPGGMPIPPMENVPVPPIAPPGGMPIPPMENVPVPPIAPPGGMPIPPEENIPVPPIAPPGGMPIPPINPPAGVPVPPIAPPGGMPIPPLNPPGGSIIVPIGFAQVRFLHAAVNYGAVNISIGSREYASNLAFGSVSSYGRVSDGFKTVTIMDAKTPRAVVYRKSIPFVAGTKITLAIINTANGIELLQVSDEACSNRIRNTGCFRFANLSYNSAPVDLLLDNGRVVFSDVRFKEVTSFKQAKTGGYNFTIVETPRRFRSMPVEMEILEPTGNAMQSRISGYDESAYLASFYVSVKAGVSYTAYLIGNDGFTPPLQIVVTED